MSSQPASSPPHRGQLVRDYALLRPDGSAFMLSDFRNKLNVVLIVVAQRTEGAAQLIRQIAEKSAEVRDNETQVMVVLRPEELNRWPVPPELIAASDPTGRCFDELRAETDTAIYFLDKFREVFHVYRIPIDQPLPTADDVLGWIRFVAMQCPECHPPEWPADAL